MDYELRRSINDLAQMVLDVYEIASPIKDIDSVVTELGGSIIEEIIPGIADGKMEYKSSKEFVIKVSPYQTKERRNFTIAHELGHLFLHTSYLDQDVTCEENEYYRMGDSEVEYEANEFAAAFLMPRNKYVEVLEENTDEDNLVDTQKIAEVFNVSADAASMRGKWLGLLEW